MWGYRASEWEGKAGGLMLFLLELPPAWGTKPGAQAALGLGRPFQLGGDCLVTGLCIGLSRPLVTRMFLEQHGGIDGGFLFGLPRQGALVVELSLRQVQKTLNQVLSWECETP